MILSHFQAGVGGPNKEVLVIFEINPSLQSALPNAIDIFSLVQTLASLQNPLKW